MYEVFETLLREKGVKVADVSKATGISQSAFSDWKAGRYAFKTDRLQKIADFFGVSVDYLTTGQKPEQYYLHPETVRIAQAVFDDPQLRMLFDAARDVAPENIALAAEMLRRFKETNPDG